MLLFLICFLPPIVWAASKNHNGHQPNFILFMADDLGYGDISCFGNKTLSTPNIDSLATEGVRLTHTVSASAVCTPSRAAFLTGRHPIRYGLIGPIPVIPFVGSRAGLPMEELTFAKILQDNGYATSIIGKWHLGLDCNWVGDKCHHPHTHGFQHFYGIPLTNEREFGDEEGVYLAALVFPQLFSFLLSFAGVTFITAVVLWRQTNRFTSILLTIVGVGIPAYIYFTIVMTKQLNSILMREDVVVEQPMQLNTITKRMVDDGLNFLQEQSKNDEPFLLYFSFNHVHIALAVDDQFSNSGPHGIYGDAVREMDWAVGKVMDMIKDLDLHENTVILFTSDHGAHIQETDSKDQVTGGCNEPFSGGKLMFGMEGGIRVPTIISWPGHFPANSLVHAPTSLMDIFPTVLALSGVEAPKDLELDGHDLSPLLTGKNTSSPHKFLFHYSTPNEIHAVRFVENEESIWKVHFMIQECLIDPNIICDAQHIGNVAIADPPLVYNVMSDVSESHPLPRTSAKYQEVLSIVQEALALHKQQMKTQPTQLGLINSMWRPWLQRCCHFPYCQCQENDSANS